MTRSAEVPYIAGYPDRLSYAAGETVSIACSADSGTFCAEIARVGARREIVWEQQGLPAQLHQVPGDASAAGCGWPGAFALQIPATWRSGYYEVVLRATDAATGRLAEHLAFFAVRPAPGAHPGRLLLVLSTNTYNAYNDWGGPSLYTGAVRASFHRPFAPGFLKKPPPEVRYPNVEDLEDPEHERFRNWTDQNGLARWSGSAGWHNWERRFVTWAEREGYGVDVAVNADLEFHPEILQNYRLVVSVGHDEYWSWGMRDALETYVGHGGNVAFFSGNAVCWQVRFEDNGATMVCYKDRYDEDPVFAVDPRRATTVWSSRVIGRPENELTGVSFSRGGYVRMGQAVPRGDDAPAHVARLAHNHAVMGTYTRGGTVFTTGTTDWAYGLAGHDQFLERITRNVLDRLLD